MKLVKYFLYMGYHDLWLRDATCRNWRQLEATQWWRSPDLKELSSTKLRRLLQYAVKHTPYYRNVCRQLRIKDLDSPEALAEFPLLDKATIRHNYDDLCSEAAAERHTIENSTSGSTGESLFFLQDRRSIGWRTAAALRSYGWCGISPFDRSATLWGARFDEPPSGNVIDRLRQYCMPLLFLSSYDLCESRMEEYARLLAEHTPRLLTSYPSPLERFAEFCRDNKISFPSLKAIVCSAEQLYDHQRFLFEDVFGVPVFNKYGSREFGSVAHECELHTGLHVAQERVHIEIVNENGESCGPGDLGEIVITDLDNYAMPFVRYRTGDLGRWSHLDRCPCGRDLSLLESIEGRRFDLIRTKSQRVISGTFWTILTRHVSRDIEAFQVRQNKDDVVTLMLQMRRASVLEAAEKRYLLQQIKDRAPDLQIDLKYVNKIPLTPGGKRRFVVRDFK